MTKSTAVETPGRRVSTRRKRVLPGTTPRSARPEALVERAAARRPFLASLCTVLLLLPALTAISACNGDSDNVTPQPRGTDSVPITRITFLTEDGDQVELFAEIADSPAERGRGLMLRESMPQNQGMLFVYEQEGQYSFWMKDTSIPLSIAFIKGDGTIVGIEDMEPLSLDGHSGDEPYLYVLEVNQGWFARNGITTAAEAQITLPAATRTPEPTSAPTTS